MSNSIAEINTELIVRYKDIDKVAGIVAEIEEYLQTSSDLDSILSRGCHVKGISEKGVHLSLTGDDGGACEGEAAGLCNTELYLSAERIVRQHGALFERGTWLRVATRLFRADA